MWWLWAAGWMARHAALVLTCPNGRRRFGQQQQPNKFALNSSSSSAKAFEPAPAKHMSNTPSSEQLTQKRLTLSSSSSSKALKMS